MQKPTTNTLSKLNKNQQQAVKTTHNSCLVLAGAGCGKTSVIAHKIQWLLLEGHIPAHRLVAITFTNKAAQEMKSRVQKLLSDSKQKEYHKQLTISTFHSLGLKLLREHHQTAQLPANFSLLDSSDAQAIIKDIAQSYRIDNKQAIKNIHYYISQCKNNNRLPTRALELADSDEQQQWAKIYQDYQQKIQTYHSLDFDDLLMLPLQLLQNETIVQQSWGQRFRHILIDEYQDTNECQYELILQLKNDHCHITAVGDDNQSIYAWRGAKPENMLRILDSVENVEAIPLSQNYRSTNIILQASNQLITNNNSKLKRQLWSELGEGNPLRILRANNEQDEAKKIIDYIRVHRIKYTSKLSDYCILYRSNFNADNFEKELQENGLAYKISGSISLFDRTEIKTLFAYLKLCANTDNNMAFLRIVNTPKREIGDTTVTKLIKYAEKSKQSLFDSCASLGLDGVFDQRTGQRLRLLHSWLQDLSETLYTDLSKGLNKLLNDTQYFEWVNTQANSAKVAEKQINRINSFCKWLNNLHQNSIHNHRQNFDGLMQCLNLLNILDNDSVDDSAINLMTIHAVKGLEFPYVFLTGMVEGTLPHHNNSGTEEGIIEERRLAYVAMTRAQYDLTLSYAVQSKRSYSSKTHLVGNNLPSRFLQEIPYRLFQSEPIKLSKAEREQQRASVIKSLKKLFSDEPTS